MNPSIINDIKPSPSQMAAHENYDWHDITSQPPTQQHIPLPSDSHVQLQLIAGIIHPPSICMSADCAQVLWIVQQAYGQFQIIIQ